MNGDGLQVKRIQQFVLASLLLAGLAVLWTERRKVDALRQENERLIEERAAAQRLISERQTRQSGPQNEELARLRTEASEVHKLRNEVSQLRAGAKEVDRLRTENQQLRAADRQLRAAPTTGVTTPAAAAGSQEGYYTKESWAFSGYATPEAALQSAIWAMREGDTRTLLASMAPQEVARMQNEWANKSEAKISADTKRGTDKISSIRVLESRRLSDDEVVLTVYAAGGEDKVQKISVKRIDAEWKLAGRKEE